MISIFDVDVDGAHVVLDDTINLINRLVIL